MRIWRKWKDRREEEKVAEFIKKSMAGFKELAGHHRMAVQHSNELLDRGLSQIDGYSVAYAIFDAMAMDGRSRMTEKEAKLVKKLGNKLSSMMQNKDIGTAGVQVLGGVLGQSILMARMTWSGMIEELEKTSDGTRSKDWKRDFEVGF